MRLGHYHRYWRASASMALKGAPAKIGHNSRLCITKKEAEEVLPVGALWRREPYLRCEMCTARLPKGRSVVCSEKCRKVRFRTQHKRYEKERRVLVSAMKELLAAQKIDLEQFMKVHDAS